MNPSMPVKAFWAYLIGTIIICTLLGVWIWEKSEGEHNWRHIHCLRAGFDHDQCEFLEKELLSK